MFIYLDESGGSTGFLKYGSSKTFNIALIICNESDSVIRVIRAFEKKQLKAGWPKGIEIKATHVFNASRNDNIPDSYKYKTDSNTPLQEVLTKLASCELEIDFLSIYKQGLTPSLQIAPFGIVYNWVAGKVLQYRLEKVANVHLIVDAQNKEIHSGKHFNGYIETRAFEISEKLRSLQIDHLDSAHDRRLRAIDFVSWAVFRKYERDDSRFYNLIRDRLHSPNCHAWFYP